MGDDPVKAGKWPSHLRARIVQAGAAPRLQGFDVGGDLARHYGFAEVMLLTLTGEIPAEPAARLFERLLVLLSPAYAGSAPTHAASVSRLCGASDAAVMATSAGLLAEAAGRSDEVAHLGWEEAALAAALADAVRESGFEVTWPDDASAAEVVAGALSACGLERDWQRTAALTLAALPAAFAEARAWRRGGFKGYPMDLPAFRYEEDGDG